MLSISVVEDDVLNRSCDLLVVKHADDFFGVDQVVAARLGFDDKVDAGKYALLAGQQRMKPKHVLFIGVGPLPRFRYAQIRQFGAQALKLAMSVVEAPKTIALTLHGTGYGLDESEAFLSLIGGLMDAVAAEAFPESLKTIEIVDHNPQVVARLRRLMGKALEQHSAKVVKTGVVDIATKQTERRGRAAHGQLVDYRTVRQEFAEYGAPSENKIKVFVAMPFKEEYSDEYDIAILEATQHANILCERIDKEAYVGDIMNQVKSRIGSYHGMLALLNDANPNVFLEIGYAWAKEKPTVLMVKKGQTLPFDISGQKCIVYTSINDLRTRLKAELRGLVDNGVLTNHASN